MDLGKYSLFAVNLDEVQTRIIALSVNVLLSDKVAFFCDIVPISLTNSFYVR